MKMTKKTPSLSHLANLQLEVTRMQLMMNKSRLVHLKVSLKRIYSMMMTAMMKRVLLKFLAFSLNLLQDLLLVRLEVLRRKISLVALTKMMIKKKKDLLLPDPILWLQTTMKSKEILLSPLLHFNLSQLVERIYLMVLMMKMTVFLNPLLEILVIH